MDTINQVGGAILAFIGVLTALFASSFVITAGIKLALRSLEK